VGDRQYKKKGGGKKDGFFRATLVTYTRFNEKAPISQKKKELKTSTSKPRGEKDRRGIKHFRQRS